jgi:beta-site APP-cleaving enzyme 1 (memapsin 2)
LGGLNSSLYKINKPIYYTKIVQERFFNVLLTSIWVGGTKIDLSCKEFNNDKTIVDSGTTDIYFPVKVFEEIKTSFTDFFKDGLPMAIPEEFWSGERKLLWRAEHIEEIYQCFPTLYLGMADEEDSSQEFSLAIVPQLYLRQIDVQAGEIDPAMCPHYSPCDAFTFGVKPRAQGTVIGANAMLGYYTVFDRENGRVGFAESTCDFRSLESSPYISGPHARDPEDCETPGPPDHWDKITYYCGAITITLAALMTAITVTVQAKRCFKARCSNMKCVSRSTTLPKRMADKIKTGHRMALESCCGRMLHCSNSDSHIDVLEDFAQPVQSSDVGPTAEAVVLHSSSLEDESNNELIVPTSRPQQAVAMARSSGAEMVGFEPKTLLEKKAGGNAVAMPSHDNRRESKRKRKKRHPVMETEIPLRDHDTLCIDCDRPRHKPPLAATDRAHSGNSAIVYDNREYQNNIKPYSLFV